MLSNPYISFMPMSITHMEPLLERMENNILVSLENPGIQVPYLGSARYIQMSQKQPFTVFNSAFNSLRWNILNT